MFWHLLQLMLRPLILRLQLQYLVLLGSLQVLARLLVLLQAILHQDPLVLIQIG